MPARWLSQWVESWWCMKSQHSKKLCLSLLMSENLKLKKVNKSFVPEPKESRQVFRVFQIPICVWTLWKFYACEYLSCIFGPIYYTWSTLNFDFDHFVFFGLSNIRNFHWLLWCLVVLKNPCFISSDDSMKQVWFSLKIVYNTFVYGTLSDHHQ